MAESFKKVRIATRHSPLALWQAKTFASKLAGAGVESVLVEITSEGDRLGDVPLWEIGGKGIFAKEVQAAVLDGTCDLAVHSAKDLAPSPLPGLAIGCYLERGDPRDVLVGSSLQDLAAGATVATGSIRRRAQLAWLRPDLSFVSLRGNIGTRLTKIPQGGAIVMAKAAIERLGLDPVSHVLSTSVMLPQVGQAAVAVECRADDREMLEILKTLDHHPTRACVEAERAFLSALGEVQGGCDLPVGAYATQEGDSLIRIEAMVASGDGRVLVREVSESAIAGDIPRMGMQLADFLLNERGMRDFLAQA